MTVRLDLTASRNEAWQPTIDILYSGDPLPIEGAVARLQWRLYEGAPGAPVLDCGVVDIADVLEDGARRLRISPTATRAQLAVLPTGLNQAEPGEADRFTWDCVLTYSDGAEERVAAGYVFVEKGTTLP